MSSNIHHSNISNNKDDITSYRSRSNSFDQICTNFEKAQDTYKRENGIISNMIPFNASHHVIQYSSSMDNKNEKEKSKEECKYTFVFAGIVSA